MRGLTEKARKQSKNSVAAVMEQKDARIRDLEAEVDLLRASHRAMIKAVGELGGMQAWLRLFNRYEALIDQMEHRAPSRALDENPYFHVGRPEVCAALGEIANPQRLWLIVYRHASPDLPHLNLQGIAARSMYRPAEAQTVPDKAAGRLHQEM
jgi:hypothetical protein